MRPVSPVLPGFESREIIFGKDQPQYLPLPALPSSGEKRCVTSRWRLTFVERLTLLFTGSLYVQQLTYGNKLQPAVLTVSPTAAANRHVEYCAPCSEEI